MAGGYFCHATTSHSDEFHYLVSGETIENRRLEQGEKIVDQRHREKGKPDLQFVPDDVQCEKKIQSHAFLSDDIHVVVFNSRICIINKKVNWSCVAKTHVEPAMFTFWLNITMNSDIEMVGLDWFSFKFLWLHGFFFWSRKTFEPVAVA